MANPDQFSTSTKNLLNEQLFNGNNNNVDDVTTTTTIRKRRNKPSTTVITTTTTVITTIYSVIAKSRTTESSDDLPSRATTISTKNTEIMNDAEITESFRNTESTMNSIVASTTENATIKVSSSNTENEPTFQKASFFPTIKRNESVRMRISPALISMLSLCSYVLIPLSRI